jgi:hypothetical protein
MKISEEHLKTIQEQQNSLNNLLNKIGFVEAQKHGFLHELAEINKVVEDFKMELETKYGQVNINVETGEYTAIEEETKMEVVKEEPANV